AEAGAAFSFHLTMGFRPLAWDEVLTLTIKRLFGSAPWAEAVPASALANGRLTAPGRDRLAAMLRELLETGALAQALDQVEIPFGRAVHGRGDGIAAVNRARQLDAHTRCALPRPAWVEDHQEGVEIVVEGRRVKGPA